MTYAKQTAILKAARKLLVKGWCKKTFIRYTRGKVQYCPWRAIIDQLPTTKALNSLRTILLQRLGFNYPEALIIWNDRHSTTKSMVLARFTRAINRKERS